MDLKVLWKSQCYTKVRDCYYVSTGKGCDTVPCFPFCYKYKSSRVTWLCLHLPHTFPSEFSLLLSLHLSFCTHSYPCSEQSQWKCSLGKKARWNLLRTFYFYIWIISNCLWMGTLCWGFRVQVHTTCSKPWLQHLPTVWLSASHLVTLWLRFLLWKMSVIIEQSWQR